MSRPWTALLLALLLAGGCPTSGDPPADDDTADDDTGDDDAADDDAGDDDSEPCEPTIEWGFAANFTAGEVVGNWALAGYVDGDGDGAVEEVEVDFDLEDVHCAGYRSLAVIAGDST